MRKKIINTLVVTTALFLIILIYFNQYPINNNTDSIQMALCDFIINSKIDPNLEYSKLDKSNSDTLEIKKMQDIGNRTLVFFSYHRDGKEFFAYAKLKKGLYSRYEIMSTSHAGGRTFSTTDLRINKKVYRVVMGKNFGREISSFKLNIDGLEFSSDISKDDYFIRFFEIPENISRFDKLMLYDQENNDITDEVEKKYPVEDGGGSTAVVEEGLIENVLYGVIIFITYAIMRIINDRSKEKLSK